MKANELMIGDWVCCTDPTPFKIEAITIIDFPEYVTGNDGFDVEIADLQPIPLTAEILEKNGFERHRILDGGLMEENWKFSDDYYDITVYEWSDSIWVYRYEGTEMNIPHEQIVISHVNELQHALKMCGVEKEIIL